MRTKFIAYTNELNEIVNILNGFPPIHTISAKELQKYKQIISRKEFLQKKINYLLNQRANIIGKYNDKNRIWLLTNMNCRKYYKLEQSAAYSRDKTLYRIGFLDYKPIPPLIQNFRNSFKENFYLPLLNKFSFLKSKLENKLNSIAENSPIYKSMKKSTSFIKNTVPSTIANSATQLAVSGAKSCIISYRHFSNSFTRNISRLKPIKALSLILEVAKQEADFEQQNPFISRIRINPKTNDYCSKITARTGYYGNETGRILVHKKSDYTDTVQKSCNPNFDLVL